MYPMELTSTGGERLHSPRLLPSGYRKNERWRYSSAADLRDAQWRRTITGRASIEIAGGGLSTAATCSAHDAVSLTAAALPVDPSSYVAT